MPAGGIVSPGWKPPPVDPKKKLFGSPSTFSAATNTQASDYDKIMQGYSDLIKSSNDPSNLGTVTPNLSPYTQSADVTGSLANLSDLATTGGYSEEGIRDLRARGMSPVRSVYASAQRNIDRQKSLQGGYSPNYTAATAKMARDMSEQIAGAETDVNARIAQNVAQNKLSVAPQYAGYSAIANAARTAAEGSDADRLNRAAEFNAMSALNRNQTTAGALGGMTSLYGTTPALVNTFGNQVVQAKQLGQGQQQLDQQRKNALLGFAGSSYRS